MNNFNILSALVFEPKRAFEELAERPRVLFPLLLAIVGTVVLQLWYMNVVDMEWLVDSQLRTSSFTGQMTEEQIAEQVSRVARNPGVQMAIGAIGAVLFILIVRLLEAVYYLLAGKIMNVQRGFKQWMALSCWTSLPGLLALIPAAIALLTATTNQIPQADLQSLSFNSLLFHREPGEPGYTLFLSMSSVSLIGLFLAALGVRQWSGRSWLFSVIYASLPCVLVYGIWALISLR
jgi:hypothetical protein